MLGTQVSSLQGWSASSQQPCLSCRRLALGWRLPSGSVGLGSRPRASSQASPGLAALACAGNLLHSSNSASTSTSYVRQQQGLPFRRFPGKQGFGTSGPSTTERNVVAAAGRGNKNSSWDPFGWLKQFGAGHKGDGGGALPRLIFNIAGWSFELAGHPACRVQGCAWVVRVLTGPVETPPCLPHMLRTH